MRIIARLLPLALALTVLTACHREPSAMKPGDLPQYSASSAAEPTPTPEPSPEPTPTPTPEPTVAPAMAAATANATKDAPQITDPATWNDAGRTTMEALAAQYAAAGMTLDEQEGFPYFLAVNRDAGTVTVYTLDENHQYTVPFMAMVCSGGTDTPTGYWGTPISYPWRLLAGPCYGQYATRIWSSYLFHSVPYYSQHKDDLEYDEFNKLGTLASLGCIRLAVVDVKWIYDNCPIGTPVCIYDDAENPGPMGKPGTIYTDPDDESKRGWDPTDPDPANPWDDAYLTGTAIRSDAAWQQYEDNREAWLASLNPTDLQGWSTDSKVEGTRG
ncbi:L,D-transpeptidase [uncultured Gemmiger sp.]|uniref:L,D-transpeptidase n=1 Tax=uncultured Gemmiger sp. TaxID=1623490 RepID=UPI002601218D|nr:L,D-transpeptidase [uncultured Gemmiger sp.]